MGIKEDMPNLARQEGVWDGSYRHYDAHGKLVDEHRSRLTCRFPEDGDFPYRQTNAYYWPDGRRQQIDFDARFEGGRLVWDNALVKGSAAELPLDTSGRSMVMYWQRADDPDLYLYEMLQLSDCGKKRARTWHWIRGGELVARTAIDEKLVSRDWRAEDARLTQAA
jgi:hypothetical protein